LSPKPPADEPIISRIISTIGDVQFINRIKPFKQKHPHILTLFLKIEQVQQRIPSLDNFNNTKIISLNLDINSDQSHPSSRIANDILENLKEWNPFI
jgi:hypothetical protein